MKKKYRSLVLIPVILLCTLFGCRKEKAELLFEDTDEDSSLKAFSIA